MSEKKVLPVPTAGRIVNYALNEYDVDIINKGRAKTGATGNAVVVGDTFPALIVRPWGTHAQAACNLHVFLDGEDSLWATSRIVAEDDPKPGSFTWPERK